MDNRASDRTSLVRHEERLTAGVERVDRGAARLRTRVVTETVTLEVEVQREVLEVDEAAGAGSGTDQQLAAEGARDRVDETTLRGRDATAGPRDEEVRTVTLHRQQPVVTLENVPYEEVRVVKRIVTVPHEVTETVRREHVEVEEVDAHGEVSRDVR